jgi:hypothetical protein
VFLSLPAGGVSPAERGLVWRFLFGMYPCSSTAAERPLLVQQMAVRYQVMKSKWRQSVPEAVRLRLNGTDGKAQCVFGGSPQSWCPPTPSQLKTKHPK